MSETGIYRWSWGDTERVDIIRITDGRAYVAWPESRRELDGVTVVRPMGWVDVARLTQYEAMSPNGVSHLVINRRCMTCGDLWRHAEWNAA